jgi:hypothetical protein
MLLEGWGKMPEEKKGRRGLTWLYILIFIYYVATALHGGGENVISKTVSNESDFPVDLTKGVNYKLLIENYKGPEKINVTISKGSLIVFEDTFKLTESRKNYLPYHPMFTVQENGTYHIHAKPLNSGTVNLIIEKTVASKIP